MSCTLHGTNSWEPAKLPKDSQASVTNLTNARVMLLYENITGTKAAKKPSSNKNNQGGKAKGTIYKPLPVNQPGDAVRREYSSRKPLVTTNSNFSLERSTSLLNY